MTELIIKIIEAIRATGVQMDETRVFRAVEMEMDNYNITTKSTELAITSDMPDHVRIYFACKKLEGMATTTMKNYSYILRDFCDFTYKAVSQITKMDIRRWIARFLGKVKESTMVTKLYCIKSFFGWLRKQHYIVEDPAEDIEIPAIPSRRRKSLTVKQLEQVRMACKDDRERAIVEIYMSTGCRVSELVGKQLSDIVDGCMSVIGKGNKERLVYFNDKAMVYLQKYINGRKYKSDYLMAGEKLVRDGSVIAIPKAIAGAAIQKIVKEIGNRCGIHLHPHIFRHTFATMMMENGVELSTVQYFLGHSDPKTTQVYAQMSTESMRAIHKQKAVA